MSERSASRLTRRKFLEGAGASVVTAGSVSALQTVRPAARTEISRGAKGAKAGGSAPRVGQPSIREEMSLTGPWRFQVDIQKEGERTGLFSPDFDATHWPEVTLPRAFDDCTSGMQGYRGTCWFHRQFVAPMAMRRRRVVIRFEGVNYHSSVWVNGKLVGKNEDAFLPFEFPVHDLLRHGEVNLIVVRVDNVRRPGELPGPAIGWQEQGGLLRGVKLVASDFARLAHSRLTAATEGAKGKFKVRAEVSNDRGRAADLSLRVQILNPAGQPLANLNTIPVPVEAGKEAELIAEGEVLQAAAWSPEQPVLYAARIDLMADGKMADQQWVRFGFRQIEAKDGKLWLNGKPIFLRGFNRHQDSPHTGMATDLETFRADVVAMKQAGANFLRPSIHPCDPGELDLCDELGILVHEGIPLNGWDGSAEGEESSRNTLQCAERQLKKMIRRDVNHPSVVFWSVSNENSETRPEVVKGDNALIQLGKRLDPTRLVVHVSERSRWIASKNHPLFEFDDVICLNAYPSELGRAWGFDPFGEYPSPKGGNPSYDFTESARFWKEAAEKLRAMYPGKPILVAEFGYPCFEKMQGSLGEDLQGRGIETEFKAIAASGFCGAAIWCYADHPWPSGGIAEYGFVSTSPYGVKSRDRKHVKAGFRVAEKSFREQGRRFAVQESS